METIPLILLQTVPILDPQIDWTKLTEVGIVAVALVILARAFLTYVRDSGKSDEREDGLLKQLIDLATSYKTESAEARDAYKAEAAATRQVVQESNDAQRAHTEAITIQTAEIRKVPVSIDLLRKDFKDYQVITADEIEGIRTEMVSFKTDIQTYIDQMLEKLGTQSAQEYTVILSRLDDIIKLLPPTPPASTVNITNIGNAPAATDEPGDVLPKAG